MNNCPEFRDHLEQALQGFPDPDRLIPLSWDEHLRGCEDCRELLHAEQALELVLASLPAPKLPPELVSRVLERLRRERILMGADLDALLDGAPDPVMPADLNARILKSVEAERANQNEVAQSKELQLDALLDLVPAPVAPSSLAADILAELESERGERAVPELHLLRSFRVWMPLAAAVLLAALWIARSLGINEPGLEGAGGNEIETAFAPELNDEMIEAFEVLENWEHLDGDDLDLLLASIDELDELMFETSEWDESDDNDEEASGG